jgi:hypothetical protein
MPDRTGLLSPEEIQHVKDWLASKEASRPCPACAFNQWTVGERVAYAPTFTPGIQVLSMNTAGYPFVVVWCGRCTYFRFHSSIAMGLEVLRVEHSITTTQTDDKEVKHG